MTARPIQRNGQQPKFPVARVAGLLSACAVTLVGVAIGLTPEIILVRVAVATFSITIVVFITSKLISGLMT